MGILRPSRHAALFVSGLLLTTLYVAVHAVVFLFLFYFVNSFAAIFRAEDGLEFLGRFFSGLTATLLMLWVLLVPICVAGIVSGTSVFFLRRSALTRFPKVAGGGALGAVAGCGIAMYAVSQLDGAFMDFALSLPPAVVVLAAALYGLVAGLAFMGVVVARSSPQAPPFPAPQ